MSRLTDLSARERRAALADVRQQLLEPARALRGYSEELYEDAKQPHLRSLLPDLQRILASATSLSDMIDQLVDHDVAAVHALTSLIGPQLNGAAEIKHQTSRWLARR